MLGSGIDLALIDDDDLIPTRFKAAPCSIVNLIVAWLTKPDCRMHSILMGEPPGSNGIGYVVRHDEDPLIYIKLKIEDDIAWVIKFSRQRLWLGLTKHGIVHWPGEGNEVPDLRATARADADR